MTGSCRIATTLAAAFIVLAASAGGQAAEPTATDKPMDKPMEKTMDKPMDKPMEKEMDKPMGAAAAKPMDAVQKNVERLLENRKCNGCDLHGADLKNAFLYNAKISDSDMKGADLFGAIVHGADFRRTDLSGATWTNGRVCKPESIGECK